MSQPSIELLRKVRHRYSQRDVAEVLNVDVRTVRRWESGETSPSDFLCDALQQRMLPFIELEESSEPRFKFIDLFAGIGGTRVPFDELGGRCEFTCEWNSFARKTYTENFRFSKDHYFADDVTSVDEALVPNHDLLIAGFPCQPFSLAGVSKKNALGRPHGFECTTQGTLFFDIARILAKKRPKVFLLENVKNLLSHDGGNTFRVILETLKELEYTVHYKVIDSRYFVPQKRERLIIVGFSNANDFSWDKLEFPKGDLPTLKSILHSEDGSEDAEEPYTFGPLAKVNPKYTLTPNLWSYLQRYAEKHRLAGNGFGFGLVDGSSVARTLSARYYKDGSEILLSQGKGNRPRRLTPRECSRLMGFDAKFKIPVSDTQAYRQFGNSVAVPVIRAVANLLDPYIVG